MVFLSVINMVNRFFPVRTKNPPRFWKRRKILKMAAHFYGRRQNCYTIALNAVYRALRNTTNSRALREKDMKELFIARISAACEQHGLPYELFKESLIRSNILLNKKVLSELAIWEPRTFKSLTEFAWKKAHDEGLNGINKLGDPPSGVILKPMTVK